MAKKVTLEDIAKALNVTKGLVSRALNDKRNVSVTMREKIIAKANELNYDFDNLRSSSLNNKTCTLILTKNILLKRDYWYRMINSFLESFHSYKINLEHQIYDENDINEKFIQNLVHLKTDAYILIHTNPLRLIQALQTTKKTIFIIDPKYTKICDCFIIKYSNYDSIYQATQFLVDKGHKSIAFYGCDAHSLSNRERHEGFLGYINQCQDKKVKGHCIIFDNTDLTYQDEELLKSFLLNRLKKITALICVNDTVAINAYKTIKSLGLKIPDDISVIGFDNLQKGMFIDPPLTTFSIPYEDIGTGIGNVFSSSLNKKTQTFQQLIVPCRMIIRNSTKRLN